jgi:signal transduction histidine kinase
VSGGVLIAGTDQPEPLPAGTELRVASFAELIGTAVSNATVRSELIESRTRMITTFDAARRRVTRDLHDGAQQRFISAIINLQLALEKLSSENEPAKPLLDLALQDASSGVQELREIAAGIHPGILTRRGLAAALDSRRTRRARREASRAGRVEYLLLLFRSAHQCRQARSGQFRPPAGGGRG